MTGDEADEMRDRIVSHLQRKQAMEAARLRDDLARSLTKVEAVMTPAPRCSMGHLMTPNPKFDRYPDQEFVHLWPQDIDAHWDETAGEFQ